MHPALHSFIIKSLMCKRAPHPCFYEFLSVSLRPLQIRVSKSQMWRAHPLGKLALNPLGRLPLVLDVLVLAQAVAPASRCDSDTSFFEAVELNSDSNTNSDPNTGVNSKSLCRLRVTAPAYSRCLAHLHAASRRRSPRTRARTRTRA